MGDHTSIEWAEATWNPVTGCTKVSPGCDHCYAETLAERFRSTPGHYFERGFDVQLRPDKLELPLRWTRPRRIFVNSMSDLFHDAIPDRYVAQVFAVMALAPQHTFQVLTKRHGRMRALLNSRPFQHLIWDEWARMDGPDESESEWTDPAARWPLPNVWLGVSTENQQWADIRIPALLDTPAAVRWISAEPLLGPINLGSAALRPYERQQGGFWEYGHGEDVYGNGRRWVPTPPAQLDWVVAGGESGRGARPMHPDWARSLRDQCAVAGIAFLVKQHGEWAPIGPLYDQHDDEEEAENARMDAVTWEVEDHKSVIQLERTGEIVEPEEYQPSDPRTWLMVKVGKKVAGRKLDGRTHDGYPA